MGYITTKILFMEIHDLYLIANQQWTLMGYLRGGTRKVGKQERNRRKNEGERAGKKHKVESGKSDAAI